MKLGRYKVTLEHRPSRPLIFTIVTAVAAIALALALSSVLFLSADAPLLEAYRMMFSYAFFNPHGVQATVQRSIYLLFCSFAFLVPFRAGLWNIGLPGQVYAGALGMFALPFVFGSPEAGRLAPPSGILIALMVTSGAVAGALIGGFAGFLRARLQVNEILVTMMLNSILFWLVSFMIKEGGPFMGGTAEGESFSLPPSLHAPTVLGLPFTAALALGAAVFIELLFSRTALGYRIRALGENLAAARYGGISPITLTLIVFLLGGAFAGLAAYHNFAAIPGVYKIPGNYGFYGDLSFYGMISALIARGSAIGALPIAVLFAGLSLGARFAQGALQLPFGVDYALLGLLMMTFVAFHVLTQFRLAWRRSLSEAPRAVPSGLAEE